ncbi:hypothetical protein O7632_01845 [Solwaraspora sp. WMMD406]|uniref:hypothetical protein n=1 Tax=Solwaraspora sp. WMMD406 TaxID=3016095 RepID=UPI002417C772|nr:hypothetical protein [Solwaraspora sp. WMMD406]MDG4762864.1 hypothetical protein [Solwaraspora sp. WMMD406]
MAGDSFCVRTARSDDEYVVGRENDFIWCDPAPSGALDPGPPALPADPLPYPAPLDPESQLIMLVGVVRGPVASVSVTMFGQTATSMVHPLPATDDRHIGAYAVWLPRSGDERSGMELSDITEVVAYDSDGIMVARRD